MILIRYGRVGLWKKIKRRLMHLMGYTSYYVAVDFAEKDKMSLVVVELEHKTGIMTIIGEGEDSCSSSG